MTFLYLYLFCLNVFFDWRSISGGDLDKRNCDTYQGVGNDKLPFMLCIYRLINLLHNGRTTALKC